MVQTKHFTELIVAQQDCLFLLTPKLCINDVDTNNNFDKMHINKAKKFIES